MSGIFGIASEQDCFHELFHGVDYHSHLGTKYGGMAVLNDGTIRQRIHDISSRPFRSRFAEHRKELSGKSGIGVISDYEPQPLTIDSRLGRYALTHVGVVRNLKRLAEEAHRRNVHFTEMNTGQINPTELIASLINCGKDIVDGIETAQDSVEGSSSLMVLNGHEIIVSRDKYGRTPIVIGSKEGATAATLETTAFPNLGFKTEHFLGPGEIGVITKRGYQQIKSPQDKLQICSFLWIYYGFPSSSYESINVEEARYRCGEMHAERDIADGLKIDFVAGIPDSGIAHAMGYANRAGIPLKRPFHKYTPTWARSFMPEEQETRDIIAEMKLVPIESLIKGKKILFCEDSIVRGTQLKKKVRSLFEYGAREVHMRPACPPLVTLCPHLNFSRSRDEFDLAARRAMREIEGNEAEIEKYLNEDSENYRRMVQRIKDELGLTSLRFQRRDDMIKAIGLPREKLCLDCWVD